MDALSVLAQTTYNYDSSGSAAGGMFMFLFYLAFIVATLAGLWKVFEKAGQPGWAAIIPIYNAYILIKIAGRPGWWLLLYLIPFVNIVFTAIVAVDIAKAFGRTALFGIVGLWIFSFVGLLVLGFGDDKYQGANPTELPA